MARKPLEEKLRKLPISKQHRKHKRHGPIIERHGFKTYGDIEDYLSLPRHERLKRRGTKMPATKKYQGKPALDSSAETMGQANSEAKRYGYKVFYFEGKPYKVW
jgi:hypothetical protein